MRLPHRVSLHLEGTAVVHVHTADKLLHQVNKLCASVQIMFIISIVLPVSNVTHVSSKVIVMFHLMDNYIVKKIIRLNRQPIRRAVRHRNEVRKRRNVAPKQQQQPHRARLQRRRPPLKLKLNNSHRSHRCINSNTNIRRILDISPSWTISMYMVSSIPSSVPLVRSRIRCSIIIIILLSLPTATVHHRWRRQAVMNCIRIYPYLSIDVHLLLSVFSCRVV